MNAYIIYNYHWPFEIIEFLIIDWLQIFSITRGFENFLLKCNKYNFSEKKAENDFLSR